MLSYFRPLLPVIRLINKILGPPHSSTPQILPGPSSYLTCNITLPNGTKIENASPDGSFVRLHHRLRLKYLLYPFLALWATGFILLIRQQWYDPSSAVAIPCTASIWNDWPPDTCGINGTDCSDDLGGGASDFRCLGGCDLVTLGNPRWVGDDQVNNVPLVIGPAAGQVNVYR